jgi:hypothetical protein
VRSEGLLVPSRLGGFRRLIGKCTRVRMLKKLVKELSLLLAVI